MAALIVFIGIFLILVGLVVLILPQSMRQALKVFLDRRWMPAASIVRIVIGLVLVFGADETRWPTFVLGFGLLMLIAGVAIPFIGFDGIERLANFWLQQSNAIIRLWSVAAMALGGALVWSAV